MLTQVKDYYSDDIYYFNSHRNIEQVLLLKDRYKLFSESKEKILPELFARHGLKVKSIDTKESNFGTGHVIYFVTTEEGKTYVYRGNVGLEEPEHYMSLEEEFVQLAQKIDFPTGKILFSDTSRVDYDFDYQIMEVLPGLDLETEREGSQEIYDTISYQLGNYVATEYKMPVQGWGRFKKGSDVLQGAKQTPFDYLTAYLDYDLQVIHNENMLSKEACDIIRKHFMAFESIINEQKQSYLVHHDLADHNIRYDKDSIVAIYDWENAVAFDPISELGSAPTWKCHYPRLEHMKKGFLDQLGYMPDYFEEKIALYFLRTMLWKMSFAIKGQRLNDRHKQLFNTALENNSISLDREHKGLGTIVV